jgi:hypothetical protein
MNLARVARAAVAVVAPGWLLLAGCRARPAPDSGFLRDSKLMAADKAAPFNRIYRNPKFDEGRFTEIYVAPVNTDYVMAQNIWEKASLASVNPEEVRKNVRLTAEYLRRAYIKAAEDDPHGRFKVVDTPGPRTLVLETAVVQLVPSKAELQALSLVPVGFVGAIGSGVMAGGSLLTGSEDQGKGVIAMEGRTRDGATGEVVWMFADREHPPTAIVDIKALFWWEPVKPICDAWARQFIQLQNNPRAAKVESIPNFQLLVW